MDSAIIHPKPSHPRYLRLSNKRGEVFLYCIFKVGEDKRVNKQRDQGCEGLFKSKHSQVGFIGSLKNSAFEFTARGCGNSQLLECVYFREWSNGREGVVREERSTFGQG